jgi:hypothetical protein
VRRTQRNSALNTEPERRTPNPDFRNLVPLLALVPSDDAVFDVDHAVRVFGDVVFVGDEHDRVAFGLQTIEQRHDFVAGLRVEVTSRFVGEDDRRLIDQGTGNRYTLPLTAGELVGLVRHALVHADRSESALRTLDAFLGWNARVD